MRRNIRLSERTRNVIMMENAKMENRTRINIKFDGEEYRVPAPDGGEAGAYYTNDIDDAICTAHYMFGPSVSFNTRRVEVLS